MDVFVLTLKVSLALMLLSAGVAKLADFSNFTLTVRLFLPRDTPELAARGVAGLVILAEAAVGAISFVVPFVRGIDVGVFTITCLFVIVAIFGYLFRRGAACRCFGQLSRRSFDLKAIARAVAICCFAAVVATNAASLSAETLSTTVRVLTALTAVMIALAVYTASRVLVAMNRTGSGVAT